jgi:hypothetical protein
MNWQWIPIETAVTLEGNPDNLTQSDELLMMMFLTEKSKKHRNDFATIPIYFGETTW